MILPMTDLADKPHRDLRKQEDMAREYIKKTHLDYETEFNSFVGEGRKGILLKLSHSILRENIDDLYTRASHVKGSDLYLKRKVKGGLEKDRTYLWVKKDGHELLFPLKGMSAYRHVEVDVPLKVENRQTIPVESAGELVYLLFPKQEYPCRDLFVDELNNGTVNLTLALTFHKPWIEKIRAEAGIYDITSSLDYVLKKRKGAALYFEQLVVDGHHLHPGAKTKIGLTYEDTYRYSPEFHQTFPLRLAAVENSALISTGASFGSLFPQASEAGKRELEQRGFSSSAFTILPVHPWQYDHAIPDIYHDELEEGTIILLSSTPVNVQATSSFRTVAPQDDSAPVLKLAVNSQMTSTVRSISMQTAMNSTVFSNMIEEILNREPHLKFFLPLNEWGGAAFRSEDQWKSRNLTMLIREPLTSHLKEGEVAVAGMSLYSQSPISGMTILHELVQKFKTTHEFTRSEAAKNFFIEYIDKILPGYLTLMVKYGVALEGHLQNSIPVFKDGRLTRFFFRDWGGARIHADRLNKQGLCPAFATGSVSVTNDLSSMHNKLYYTVFQNHLGEIIRQLVEYGGIDEEVLWADVKDKVDETLRRLSREKELETPVKEDRNFLFQKVVMHKSLTKMRLLNRKGDVYTEVPNPLA